MLLYFFYRNLLYICLCIKRKYKRKQNNNAIKFYQDVLDKKVSLENIEIKDKKIVGLKLSVLTMLMNINRNAKKKEDER